MRKLPNHETMPQALRHLDPDYDPYAPVGGKKHVVYPVTGVIYFRGSTDEWVLELEGTINGVAFTSRHPAPKALAPEDVIGLPHLYPEPINRDAELKALIEALEARLAGALT